MENSSENVLTLFVDLCRKHATRTAVCDGERRLSYRELDQTSSAVAHRLSAIGVAQNDVVPIVTQSSIEMVIGVLGILKAGATYAPLDSSQWPLAKIHDTVSRLCPKVVLRSGIRVPFVPGLEIVSVEEILRTSSNTTDPDHTIATSYVISDTLACIIFTSGTTGDSKGVMIRHSSLLHFVTSPPFNYNVTGQDRVLLVLSCAFDACMGTMFSVLCNGGCIVIADSTNFHERARQCTVFVGTPSILESLDAPKSPHDYPLLDRLVLGGETPSKKLLEKWAIIRRPIWIAYGPTEATCATLTGEITVSGSSEISDPRLLGLPISGSKITIVDKNMNPVTSFEEEGELLISGPGLAMGYWKNDQLTTQKFIQFEGARTYITGDYAKWTKDFHGRRTVYFCGRRDRVVKIRGFLVNLETDVDAAAMKHIPEIKSIHSYYDGVRICTAVIPQDLEESRLLSQLRLFMPQYIVPDRIFAVEKFPQNAYGKTDVRFLENLLLKKLEGEAMQHWEDISGTKLGRDLLDGLSNILNITAKDIHPTQSFIGNGLYSLTATRLCFYLRNRGYKFRPVDFLSSLSISSFLQAYHKLEAQKINGHEEKYSTVDETADFAPLTSQQLRLIHGTSIQPHFNIVNYVLECDSQHLDHLTNAWTCMEQIEPIFRTKIVTCNGDFKQHVVAKPCSSWSQRNIQSSEFENELVRIAAGTGLAHQFIIINLRDTGRSAIVWSIHHALMDGFSASLIIKKLEQLMRGEIVSPSMPFPAAIRSVQAVWERESDTNLRFWEEHEVSIPQVAADLPVAEIRTSRSTLSHRTHPVIFEKVTADAVANYCAKFSVTPAAIHYATWSLVLSTYTGCDNVIFGAVFSGRGGDYGVADCLIGCLLDTLPLRIHVERDDIASEFNQRIHGLVHEVSKFHGLSNRVTQTPYSTAVSCDPEISDQGLASLGFNSRVLQYPDLPLLVLVQEDGNVTFFCKTEKFSEDFMMDLGEVYKNIFTALLDPSLSIKEVLRQKYSKERQHQMLQLGNLGRKETYNDSAQTTIARIFDDAAMLHASKIAIEKGNTKLTYLDVKDKVDHLAAIIQPLVKPGEVVCVLADRSINWVISIFALLKVRAVYCPIDVANRSHQDKIIRVSKASLVLFDRINQQELFSRNTVSSMCVSEVLKHPKPLIDVTRYPKPDDAAFLVFTSGSTGERKGILIESRSLVALKSSYDALFPGFRGARIAQFLSPAFDVAMHEIIWSISTGGTLVLRTNEQNPFSHLGRVDTVTLTPSVAANLDPNEYPNIRNLHLAGEPLSEHVVKLWDSPVREIYNSYGPAEATVVACTQRLKSTDPVTLGPPIPTIRLYILNDHMELLSPGVIGNIYVAGVQVSRGYVNNEIANATAFSFDPFVLPSSKHERLYRTGDLGHVDRQGRVYYHGRKDRQIKLRGFRTNLDDVAYTARRVMPTLKGAFATERDGRLILWIEPKNVDEAVLRENLAVSLPAHAVPSTIVAMEQLPLNHNGKVDSKKLNSMILPNRSKTTSSEVCRLTPVESLIAEEWRDLLSLEKTAFIESGDSFPTMGGHSVLQLALTARLKEKFKVPVTVKDVIDASTLGKLAARINEKLVSQATFRRTPEITLPLGQEQLSPPELDWWHRYEVAEQQSAFNVPFVAKLGPSTDLRRLKIAIESAVARHDVLRSQFIAYEGRNPLRILSQNPILVHAAKGDFDIKMFMNRPFDLTKDPLVRVTLTKELVAFSISHMVVDLTAFRQLLLDISFAYNIGIEPVLPHPRQYFDILWDTPLDQNSLSFWPAYLDGTNPCRRRPKRSYRGASLFADIDDGIYQTIITRITQQHLSLYQFTLAAVGIVLQSLGGRTPLIIGTPYINRTLDAEDHVVGLCIEPLPIRIDWPSRAEGYDSNDILLTTKMSAQSALAHAVPWPRLLESLDIPFPSRTQEVFDVVVTVHDDRRGGLSLAIPGSVAMDSEMERWYPDGAKFPLCFELQAYEERLTVRLEYDTDIMEAVHARILQHLLSVAVEGLVQADSTYTEISGRIESETRKSCKEHGVWLGELANVVKTSLM